MRHIVISAVVAMASTAAAAQDEASDADDPFAGVPLIREAGTLSLYLEDVRALSVAEIASAAALDEALETVAANRFEDLAPGATAFSALLAAQSPEFIDGVREVADYYGRRSLLTGLRNDPAYAGYFPGAEQARAVINMRLDESAERVTDVATRLHQNSYALQNQDWARSRLRNADERLAALDALALTPRIAPTTLLENIAAPGVYNRRSRARETEALAAAFNEAFGLSVAPMVVTLPASVPAQGGDRVTMADRAMTLAAFEALNQSSPENARSLLLDPDAQSCLELARLQFNNCVSVAAYRYEDAACIAQYGLNEVAACLSAAAR